MTSRRLTGAAGVGLLLNLAMNSVFGQALCAAEAWVPPAPEPSLSPQGTPGSEPTRTLGAGRYSAAALAAYGQRPSAPGTNDNGVTSAANTVERRVGSSLSASWGVHPLVTVNALIPWLWWQDRGAAALGDLALRSKLSFPLGGRSGGLGLGLLSTLGIPTGSPHQGIGQHRVHGRLEGLAELRLLLFTLRVQGGYLVQDSAGLRSPAIPLASSLLFRPQWLGWDPQGHWLVVGQVRTWLTPQGQSLAPSILPGVSVRYGTRALAAFVGSELTLDMNGDSPSNGIPELMSFVGVSWTPQWLDGDHDGIRDDRDLCPDQAEDMDGEEDHDGCPEQDPGSVFGAPL